MGRYDPLKTFLTSQSAQLVPMTFREIEGVVGVPLPSSKKYPAWWSNNPSNNTMTQAWLEAGFATEQVDIASERLVFRRTVRHRGSGDAGDAPLPPPSKLGRDGRGLIARLQAALGGTVRYADGFDPTQPTGDVWDAGR